MQRTKSVKPPESPADSDPVSRLVEKLESEGFTAFEEGAGEGERIYRRPERVLFAEGETVFVLIDFPHVDEKVLKRAVESISNLFAARGGRQKALSVFQSTTVYVCIVARSETPHNESLAQYVQSSRGSVMIPVVLVPEINQVVYPNIEEKVGSVQPRIEYLKYLLGERREPVSIHQQTIRTFWVSTAIVAGLVVLGIILAQL